MFLMASHKSIKDFMDFCADISFDKFRKAVRENLLTSRYDKTSIDWGRMGTEAARNFNVARPAGAAFPRPAAGCQGLTEYSEDTPWTHLRVTTVALASTQKPLSERLWSCLSTTCLQELPMRLMRSLSSCGAFASATRTSCGTSS